MTAREPTSLELRRKYLKTMRLPTIFCPGCGLGVIINIMTRSFEESGIQKDDIVLVSGIGCTARIPGYFDMDSIHTTHGRAIPIATAIKLTNPDLHVVVISGDGDLGGIGGNHFIHAVRRNVEIKVICATNFTYAMTGGQNSPTTPHGLFSPSYPWKGNPEDSFDLSRLAMAGGAPFVARWTTYHPRKARKAITRALHHPGFSFIELLSPCPTNFGRRNDAGTIVAMKAWMRDRTYVIDTGSGDSMNDAPRETYSCVEFGETKKIPLGILQVLTRTTFEKKWTSTCKNAKAEYRRLRGG